MSRRWKVLTIVAILVLALTGCTKEEKLSYDYDYNQESGSYNSSVWTPKGTYSVAYSILHYTSPNGKTTILCSKPECKHNDINCEAYIETPNLIFYKDKLCYAVVDPDKHKTDIYTMNWKGKERKKYFTIEFPDDFKKERIKGNVDFSGSSKIKGNTYVEEVSMSGAGESTKSKVYLTNLDEPTKPISLNTEVIGNAGLHKIEKKWLLFAGLNPSEPDKMTLIGYNRITQEQRVLVNAPYDIHLHMGIGDVKIKGDVLYWHEYKSGFFKKNIKKEQNPDKKTKFLQFEEGEQKGMGYFGKDYLIYCNTNMPKNPIPEEKEGISFYSYEGELIEFIPTKNQGYIYYMETEDKYYFINPMESLFLPAAYIEKASIKDGTSEIIQVENIKESEKDD